MENVKFSENEQTAATAALEEFKKQYPSTTSGDLQAFVLGFTAAVGKLLRQRIRHKLGSVKTIDDAAILLNFLRANYFDIDFETDSSKATGHPWPIDIIGIKKDGKYITIEESHGLVNAVRAFAVGKGQLKT